MLRQRFKKSYKVVKELNAFPKIPEAYVETSSIGGTVTVLSWLLIAFLIFMETSYWLDTRVNFKFEPDTDLDAKLTINLDITVAMICSFLTVDVVDPTNQEMSKFGVLKKEDVTWALTPEESRRFASAKHMNAYLSEEFHALQHLLFKSGGSGVFGNIRPSGQPKGKYGNTDACRIHGTLTLNKVAGSIHILPGITMTLEVPDGHVHISGLLPENEHNFTHRIHHFSFGDPSAGIIQPLEGDEKVTTERKMMFQYFLSVVPTDVDTFFSKMQTYQYSVRDSERPIDHFKGSHGISGLFFKYDMSALKVRVIQERDSILQFLLRISSIICGIYVCSGVLSAAIRHLRCMVSPKTTKESKGFSEKIRGPLRNISLSPNGAPVPVAIVPQSSGIQDEKFPLLK